MCSCLSRGGSPGPLSPGVPGVPPPGTLAPGPLAPAGEAPGLGVMPGEGVKAPEPKLLRDLSSAALAKDSRDAPKGDNAAMEVGGGGSPLRPIRPGRR